MEAWAASLPAGGRTACGVWVTAGGGRGVVLARSWPSLMVPCDCFHGRCICWGRERLSHAGASVRWVRTGDTHGVT